MTVCETGKTMIHESFCYDDAAHAQFEKRGYVIFDHFLTDTAIQEMLGHATRIVAETARAARGRSCSGCTKLWIWRPSHRGVIIRIFINTIKVEM